MSVYLIIVVVLFILAISDLVVGVSNDAVNFLNAAVGSRSARFKTIIAVAGLGVFVGAVFSTGMMEVARKGIFHPEYFAFSEIMILFLAVMVTDVILLDAFNTFGMPTSTTVSIVFELLGAAVAVSLMKILIEADALTLAEYINSSKALAIISGILVSVVLSFLGGVIVQYLTRLLFSFDYRKNLKKFGALWGGMAFAAITYFLLIKGIKNASFMTDDLKHTILENTWTIILLSFAGWAIVLQLLLMFTRLDVFKPIVLVGTFALAMAFAGNDLVNFIGVPLAGFNSYQLYMDAGAPNPDSFMMTALAGKVPTPTVLLLIAGLIMVITLWTSKKAKSVLSTSVDLGRQYEGAERFDSFAVSRSLVRNFARLAEFVNERLPDSWKSWVESRFDDRSFTEEQKKAGEQAPAFDMVRAAVTLMVASILISIGTTLKLPLSTTYVTFMVFMGASLADGAWGRESAVYRISGVLSVIGGWFFTALSAFTVAFVFAIVFYFGGALALGLALILVGYVLYRTHKYHSKKIEEDAALTEDDIHVFTREVLMEKSIKRLREILGRLTEVTDKSLTGLEKDDLYVLRKVGKEYKAIEQEMERVKSKYNRVLDQVPEEDIIAGQLYVLVVDYLDEMVIHIGHLIKPIIRHVDNSHKPLTPIQIEELKDLLAQLKLRFDAVVRLFETGSEEELEKLVGSLEPFMKAVRSSRKKQIKRIRNHEVGTRNSVLHFLILGEMRNLALFSNRLVRVYEDLVMRGEGG